MRDAVGGTVSLGIIIFFIVLALGYSAFTVNYTKAFRMKDKIIATYDDYKGICGDGSDCQTSIKAYASEIGYVGSIEGDCGDKDYSYTVIDGLYCIREVLVEKKSAEDSNFGRNIKGNEELSDLKGKKYYHIVTKIDFQIPVISNLLDFKFFYIHGDTKTYKTE